MDKFLYFRSITDVDSDDGSCGAGVTSVCIPAKNIMSMAPASDTTLQIRYKSMKNSPASAAGAQNDEILTDTITLTVNAHTHKNVVDALIAAINSNKLYTDGFIDVIDIVTTNLANETIDAIFFHPDLTGVDGYTSETNCTALTVAAAIS
jgi:hypothetical protein|tara:strand:+ start:117 stop:566 length:450 start_codon:yes stop_codon:yes gene_type:complete